MQGRKYTVSTAKVYNIIIGFQNPLIKGTSRGMEKLKVRAGYGDIGGTGDSSALETRLSRLSRSVG
jgi:hypothetical protein